MQGIGRRVASGAAWLILFNLLQRCLGFVSTMILARLLVPADFGLIAMGMSIFAVLEIMSTFSFDLVLIQNKDPKRRHYDTAWTFNVIFGIINGLAMAILAHPAAIFFKEPRVEPIMYALCACAWISGFDNIGIVGFQKDLELHKEFRLGMVKKLTAFTFTVSLAFALRNYWALIAGMLAGRVAASGLSYWMHSYRPRFSLEAGKELFHFSKWLLINNLLIFANNRGVDFIIAKIAGAGPLGLYSVAYEVSNLPTTELVFPISRAVFPGYSKLAGNIQALRNAFLDVTSIIAIVTIPAGIGIALVAEPLVFVVLGAKWVEAIPLMHVLAIFGVARALQGPIGPLYLAIGKPRLMSVIYALQIALALPLLLLLIERLGTWGAAWGILIAAAITMPVNYVMVMRVLELSYRDVMRAFWRPLIAALAMSAVCLVLKERWLLPSGLGRSLAGLLVLIGAGAAAYMSVVFGFWRLAKCPHGAESRLLSVWRLRFARTA